MDEFLLELQAKLDEAKSKGLINADIEKIQQQLDKLKLKAEIDPKSISNITRRLESIIGEKITIGLTANIDNNAINQIKKASDSATNAVIQNEKKKQEAYKATADAVVYHAGVISKLNKAETNGRFYGSNRGTGYYGTGHYFVDSATKRVLDSDSEYSKLPYTSVDISQYENLFKANTNEIARQLHDFLKNLTRYTQGSDKFNTNELFAQFEEVFGNTILNIQEFESKLEQFKTFMSNSSLDDRSDSVSTQFMKSLGYGGVDTRGTKYANTEYGTVIYDLKEESILQANITDELQKQGQMLEKIDYSKGQVFDKEIDERIQSQINGLEKIKEIKEEAKKLFDETNLKNSESELNATKSRLEEIDSIIANCLNAIDNAEKEAKRFAKETEEFGLSPMSESEIQDFAKENAISYQERVNELSLERAELEKRLPILEENYIKEIQLSGEAFKQAQQIVEQRHLEAQEASEAANTIIQNEEKKQQAIQETVNAYKSLTENESVIKSGSAVTTFSGVKEAQEYFKELLKDENAVIATTEQFGSNNNLASFAVNIKRATGEVETLRYAVDTLKDDNGNITDIFYTLSGSTFNDSGAIKQLKQIEEAASKAQKVLAQFNNKSGGTLINSDEFKAVQEAIDGLGNTHSIDDLNKAMNHLETTYNDMVSMIRNSGKSFNPFIDARNEMDIMDKKIEGISLEFEKLSNKPQEVADSIKQLSAQQEKVNSYTVGTKEWASAYGELQKQIKQVNAEITNLKKAESAKSLQPQVDKIQLSLDTGEYESKVDNLIARTKQWTDENGNARISTVNLEKSLDDLQIAYENLSKSNTVENQQALIEKEKQLETQIKTVTSEVRSMNAELAKSSAVDFLHNQVVDFISKNGKSMKYFSTELKDIFNQTASGAKLTKTELSELKQKFIDVQNEARQTGKLGKTWFQTFKEGIPTFTSWISASSLVMKVINSIRQAATFTTELNSALTNINYTMDVTSDQLENIGKKSISIAKNLNTSAENVLGAVKLYANAKETADTILQKAQPAIMLSNVAGFTGEQSAKYLQTIMNQFDLTQDDLMGISDIIQSVSQNMAHDFSDGLIQINEGIETSGEVARAAGMDLAEYASMIGLLVEKTGLAGSQIGNSIKTIITRTTKAGKILGIDEGEISDAERSLKNVGIAVRETDGEFREFKDTMRDLSEVWDDLSDVEKSNIAFNLAGTRQINVIQTLLRNWSDYEDLVIKANESAGVTFENQEKYAESLEGKMEGLSATMTSVWENLINEDSVSPVVDILSKLADGLDVLTSKLGLLGTLGAGAGLFAGIKNTGRSRMLLLQIYMPVIILFPIQRIGF